MPQPHARKATPEQGAEIDFLESVLRVLPQDVLTLTALGDLYTAVGRIADGLDVDRQLVYLCPDEDLCWYNLACSLALSDQSEEALEALARAVELGYDDTEHLVQDEDLASLRSRPLFKQLLQQLRQQAAC